MWIAICRTTKHMVGFVIGSIGKKAGKNLWQKIKHIPCQVYCTDYWQAYTSFIPRDKHRVLRKKLIPLKAISS